MTLWFYHRKCSCPGKTAPLSLQALPLRCTLKRNWLDSPERGLGYNFKVGETRLLYLLTLQLYFIFKGKFSFSLQLLSQERRLSTGTSRTMAAMSLGFIVLVTPWTIQEVVAACTGSRAPAVLDFLATWLALSNSFWNPFLYWLLNNHFRRISRELLFSTVSSYLVYRDKINIKVSKCKSFFQSRLKFVAKYFVR